jgi:DNA polymerase-3 subunit gamma/tau
MTYQVLARRLRPQRFEDVVGQDHVTRTLRAAIAADRVAHAFLFTGPRGVGKTTTARLLAKALNCDKGPTPEPCNACSNCREIADGNAFDVLEIDGASHTQVDKMRDLMETVAHRPIKSRFKIFVIDEVHMLSSHSFNALLKTLEEPPPHVKFIFATTDPHKVLPTVVSRCQRYDLRRIGLGELRVHLRKTVDAEGVRLSDESIALLAREAEGSLRDAQSLLEQVLTVAGSGADEGAVRDVLGAADRRLVVEVVDAILAGDPAAGVRHLAELHTHGYDAQRFCRDLLEHWRHLAVLRATDERSLLADLPEAEVEVLAAQGGARPTTCCALPPAARNRRSSRPRPDGRSGARARMAVCASPRCAILRSTISSAGGSRARARPPPASRRPRGPARAGVAPAGPAGGGLGGSCGVREEKVALYLSLAAPGRSAEGGAPIGVESEALRLGSGEGAPEAIAREVAGRPLRVEVGPLPREFSAETPMAQARRRTEETLADPLVQAAVEIFGGEVRGVRERRGS